MFDDKTKEGPRDASRVNLNEDYEIAHSTKRFGCSAEELKAAVKSVGPSVNAVESYLGRAKSN